jgi:hypothetical protein
MGTPILMTLLCPPWQATAMPSLTGNGGSAARHEALKKVSAYAAPIRRAHPHETAGSMTIVQRFLSVEQEPRLRLHRPLI